MPLFTQIPPNAGTHNTMNSQTQLAQKGQMKMLPHGLTANANSTRLSRMRNLGLNIYKIPLGSSRKTILASAMNHCFTTWKYRAQDDLKAPMGNKAKPAFFSPASTNFYEGSNLSRNEDGTLERVTYGNGSGGNSIALNPRTLKIRPIHIQSVRLMKLVTEVIANERPDLKPRLLKHPFNSPHQKMYHEYVGTYKVRGQLVKKKVRKSTGWHVDTTYSKSGNPMENNSQVPGSLVAILTLGASKNLWFRRHLSSKEYKDSTLIHFLQSHGTLYVMDTACEKPDENGWHWRHMSDMTKEGGITFSYIFRCVQNKETVEPNGALTQPHITSHKEKTFAEGEDIFNSDEYKTQREQLNKEMVQFFQTYKR